MDYISREAVMSKCNDIWDNADETTQTGVDTINTIDEITDFIESLPSADVQPVKRGQWIADNKDNRGYADCYTCTNCDCYTYTYTLMKDCEFDYCPHCGARMDLGDEKT